MADKQKRAEVPRLAGYLWLQNIFSHAGYVTPTLFIRGNYILNRDMRPS